MMFQKKKRNVETTDEHSNESPTYTHTHMGKVDHEMEMGSLVRIKPKRRAGSVQSVDDAFAAARKVCQDKGGLSIMTEFISIHPITLAFSKPDTEQYYMAAHKKKHQPRFRFFLRLTTATLALFSLVSYSHEHDKLFYFNLGAFVLSALASFVSETIYAHDPLLILTSASIICGCLASTIIHERDDGSLFLECRGSDVGFIFLCYAVLGSVIGLRFITSVVISSIIASMSLVAIVFSMMMSPTLDSLDLHVETITYVVFGFYFFNMVLGRKLEIQERRDYRLTNRLAAENVNVKMEMENLSLFTVGIGPRRGAACTVTPGGPLSPANRISASAIEIISTLGSGSYGDVMKGRYKATIVAVKKVRNLVNEHVIAELGAESSIMADLRHPNVVMFMGVCLNPPMIVMEYCSRNSVFNVVHVQHKRLDWSLVLRILVDAAHGMAFLHKHDPPILHQDLKSMNLLLDENWRCKVSDFGLSKFKQKATRKSAPRPSASRDEGGSIPWLAPEVGLSHQNLITEKSDVYSFGVIVFELVTKTIPFAKVAQASIPLLVSDGKRPMDYIDSSTVMKHFPSKLRPLVELMQLCWHANPVHRPEFETIVEILEQTICPGYFGNQNIHDATVFPREINIDLVLPSDSQGPEGPASPGQKNLEFHIQEHELELSEKIGGGSYGAVYSGTWIGTSVAIKQLFIENLPDQVLVEFHKECDLMRQLRHPNVVLFMGSSAQPPNLYLVTEIMQKGSLFDIYHNEQRLSSTTKHYALVLKIAADMARGMAYLHSRDPPLIHRDLKSPNIMADEHWTCKIGDFGLSRLKDETKTMTKCGSPLWVAPEILQNLRFTEKCDVYSFAVIVWEAMAWSEPYPNMSSKRVMKEVATRGLRPPIPRECPAAFRALLAQCWKELPTDRPTFPDILDQLDQIELSLPRQHGRVVKTNQHTH